MILRWLLASIHLLGLGIGLGAVLHRAWELRGTLDVPALRRAFRADTLWGLAAFLWISTGLWRALASIEKPFAYYLGNHIFLTKMGLLLIVLALEILPMITLIRWRKLVARGDALDTSRAPLLARISVIQAVLVILLVFAASAMARGIGS
jgi:putative membrane protein